MNYPKYIIARDKQYTKTFVNLTEWYKMKPRYDDLNLNSKHVKYHAH